VALSGNAESLTNEKTQTYKYKIGAVQDKHIMVKEKAEPNLAYAPEVVIRQRDDQWTAYFPDVDEHEECEATLQIVRNIMQYFQIKNQGVGPSSFRALKLSPDGWEEKEKGTGLMFDAKLVSTADPIAIKWAENSKHNETLIWWTLVYRGEKADILRIRRSPGSIENQPDYEEYKTFVKKIRKAFLSGKLSGEEIWKYPGAVEVSFCSIKRRQPREGDSTGKR